MKILNLTQHLATADQQQAGVVEPADKTQVAKLLTFKEIPTKEGIQQAATAISKIAQEAGVSHAMIGGAPFLMGPLETSLRLVNVTPIYAFSRRESVEETMPDGSVWKGNVFKHVAFVEAV